MVTLEAYKETSSNLGGLTKSMVLDFQSTQLDKTETQLKCSSKKQKKLQYANKYLKLSLKSHHTIKPIDFTSCHMPPRGKGRHRSSTRHVEASCATVNPKALGF